MLVTILGGLGALALVLVLLFGFLVIVGGLIYMVVSRSKAKGVVFKDGVSNDEAKLVLEAISDVAQEEKVRQTLEKYASFAQRALAKVATGSVKEPPVVNKVSL